MAAEIAKLRCRQIQDFVSGEHVWVDATYFDDPKSAPENRFSTSCGEDKKVYGVIHSVASGSCKIVFDDGTKSYVAKAELHPAGNARIVNSNENDEEDSEENEDEEWKPVEEESSDEDEENERAEEDDTEFTPAASERLYYLMDQDRKLFVGKLIPGADVVHNIPLVDTQRKFEIVSVIDAKQWEHFDEDRHTEGTFIAWDLKYAQVKVSVCTCTSTHRHTCTYIHTNKVSAYYTHTHTHIFLF